MLIYFVVVIFFNDHEIWKHRGSAHVGMIKAMIEANIPIDMIGGTSIGSFMGALWAEENSYDRFVERAREWSFVSLFIYKRNPKA